MLSVCCGMKCGGRNLCLRVLFFPFLFESNLNWVPFSDCLAFSYKNSLLSVFLLTICIIIRIIYSEIKPNLEFIFAYFSLFFSFCYLSAKSVLLHCYPGVDKVKWILVFSPLFSFLPSFFFLLHHFEHIFCSLVFAVFALIIPEQG